MEFSSVKAGFVSAWRVPIEQDKARPAVSVLTFLGECRQRFATVTVTPDLDSHELSLADTSPT